MNLGLPTLHLLGILLLSWSKNAPWKMWAKACPWIEVDCFATLLQQGQYQKPWSFRASSFAIHALPSKSVTGNIAPKGSLFLIRSIWRVFDQRMHHEECKPLIWTRLLCRSRTIMQIRSVPLDTQPQNIACVLIVEAAQKATVIEKF